MRVVILLQYDLHHEPRARRQVAALREEGHEVTVVGATGSSSAMPDVDVVDVRPQPLHDPGRWTIAVRQGVFGRLSPQGAYWADPANHRFLKAVREHPADLVIAHDWSTLPIALRATEYNGAPVLYDTHEYALEQGVGRWRWRWVFPHIIKAVEGRAIHRVAEVMTVSEGIADQLVADHGLVKRPLVVRNTPWWEAHPVRSTGERIEVLYHGLLNASRGLEALVDSVAIWQHDRDLVLRGPGAPRYVDGLRRRAEAAAPGRVRIEPPVAPDDIISASLSSDVGIFVGDPAHGQLRFALPNKLFEYAMAGLAVVTTPLPEVERINATHDLAVITRGVGPASIADAINGLSRSALDARKGASLAAARDLCWDREQQRFLAAVSRAVNGGDRA